MSDKHYLDWPFLDERHRTLERELDAWAAEHVAGHHGADVDEACRALVRALGQGGWLAREDRERVGGGAACQTQECAEDHGDGRPCEQAPRERQK